MSWSKRLRKPLLLCWWRTKHAKLWALLAAGGWLLWSLRSSCTLWELWLFRFHFISLNSLCAQFAGSSRACVPALRNSSRPQPITVLLYSQSFRDLEGIFTSLESGSFAGFGQPPGLDAMSGDIGVPKADTRTCSVQCTVSVDPALLSTADVVLFEFNRFGNVYGPHWCHKPLPLPAQGPKPPHQLWGWLSFEQPAQFPILLDPRLLAITDFHMNWRQDSDLPVTLFCPWLPPFGDIRAPVPFALKQRPEHADKLVLFLTSRCRSKEREAYVRELMQYISVHAVGDCLHNKDFPAEYNPMRKGNINDRSRHKWSNKLQLLTEYKFVLAFENEEGLDDWVTEKPFHGWLAGTIPVYWGAPNVDEWAPDAHSLIKTTDFASPKALAAHLLRVAADEQAYAAYFAWKQRPLAPSFQRLVDRCVYNAECRMCEYYHHRRCHDEPVI